MPKLREIEINDDQVMELVQQLEFEKKISLITTILREKQYRENFYRYTEELGKKHHIPTMSEDELDTFLHNKQ